MVTTSVKPLYIKQIVTILQFSKKGTTCFRKQQQIWKDLKQLNIETAEYRTVEYRTAEYRPADLETAEYRNSLIYKQLNIETTNYRTAEYRTAECRNS